jgi:hypothetical protein
MEAPVTEYESSTLPWMEHSLQHRCRCASCDPSLDLASSPDGEGHTSYLWSETGPEWRFAVDGIPLRYVREMHILKRYAIILCDPLHVCACEQNACSYRVEGVMTRERWHHGTI